MQEKIETSAAMEDAIERCAQEPIRTPGSIQPHGILFVLDDSLKIVQVSENCSLLLLRSADSLIGTSILDLVTPASRGSVETLVRDAAFTYVNPFRVPILVGDQLCNFDGITHVVAGTGTIVELELDPNLSASTAGLDNYLQIVQCSLSMIAETDDVTVIAGVMAREIKAFTGFDRVMVYQFAPDDHGHVVAEAKEEEMEPYLGLHYPASDIPPQARELYRTNPVRLLQDVDATPAPMFPPTHPARQQPLDMSRAVLRSMSPVHIQYLKNMGVGASMSISLIVHNKLWGLIACHHRTPHFVPYAIRATVSLYGIVMAAQLDAKEHSSRNQRVAAARRNALSILTAAPDLTESLGNLPAMLPRLMNLFSADGALLITGDQTFREGVTPEESTWKALQADLQLQALNGVIIAHRTGDQFPSLASSIATAAGLVAIHLGGREWLIMFRREILRRIAWAGNPNEAKLTGPSGSLTPRSSFAMWMQEVIGECEPWPEETASLTTEVRSALLEILQRRNILLARSNQDLRRFAGVVAHEVKNHLQTSIMALSLIGENGEGPLPSVLREMAVIGSDRLSGLAKFVDELLTFAGTDASTTTGTLDLNRVLPEIVKELEIAGLTTGAIIHIGHLPTVVAFETQLRHVLTNLIRNALIHARNGDRPLNIEIGSRKDASAGIVYIRDDGKGIPEHQQDKIFDYFYRGDSNSAGSGIGLAFCAQALDRMGMRLWLEESSTQGTTFCFTVRAVG